MFFLINRIITLPYLFGHELGRERHVVFLVNGLGSTMFNSMQCLIPCMVNATLLLHKYLTFQL